MTTHTINEVLEFSKNHDKHTVVLTTEGNYKSAIYGKELTREQLEKLCLFLEGLENEKVSK